MKSGNILIALDVKALLPEVLIDYICNLVWADGKMYDSEQAIELIPDMLSGRSIQSIFHGGKRHRVFGFEPVNCKLHVIKSHNQYQMLLAGWTQALCQPCCPAS